MIQNINFEIPLEYISGIQDGSLERFGGIIRDAKTKVVRAWLKEVPVQNEINSNVVSQLSSLSSSMLVTNALQVANLGVSIAGFAMVAIKLNKLSNQIDKLAEQAKEIKEISRLNQNINLFQIISHYQNFETQLRDFTLAQNREDRKAVMAQSYTNLCQNTIVVSNLLKDQESLKYLSIDGMDKIYSLLQFVCLSYRSLIVYNTLAREEQIVKIQLEDAKETLFLINKNFVSVHRNLGWPDRVLSIQDRDKLEQVLNTSIEVENLYESKIIYLNTVEEPLKIETSENYQLAFVEVA